MRILGDLDLLVSFSLLGSRSFMKFFLSSCEHIRLRGFDSFVADSAISGPHSGLVRLSDLTLALDHLYDVELVIIVSQVTTVQVDR